MLWYKAWIESRWRLCFSAVMYGLQMFVLAKNPDSIRQHNAFGIMNAFGYVWLLTAVFAAGNGLKTQSARMTLSRDVAASTWFTVTLPVSRFRLFATRSVYGLVQMFVVLMLAVVLVWALFPDVHNSASLSDAILCGLTFAVCCSIFYFVSALISVFLDPQWQVYSSLLAVGLAWFLTSRFKSSWNVFRVFSYNAPMVTHTIPWTPILVSLWIATLLFVFTARVIETREF